VSPGWAGAPRFRRRYFVLGILGILHPPPFPTLPTRGAFAGLGAAAFRTDLVARPAQLPRPLFTMPASMLDSGAFGPQNSLFFQSPVAATTSILTRPSDILDEARAGRTATLTLGAVGRMLSTAPRPVVTSCA